VISAPVTGLPEGAKRGHASLARPAERIVAFYNHRGTCVQYIKEDKGAIKWTRQSCRSFVANAVRLKLHALAYNLGNSPSLRFSRVTGD
jgi:hypothetical protein